MPPLDRVLLRYLGLQVPGWILAIVVLVVVRHWIDLSVMAAAGVLALLVVKDLLLYPFVRGAYATDARHGTELLVGSLGVVTSAIRGEGYVRIRGELWRAEAADAGLEIPRDAPVVVASARGLTLIVRRTEAPRPAPDQPVPTPSRGSATQ